MIAYSAGMIRKYADRAPLRVISRAAEWYLRAFYNERHWNADTNGEDWVLRRIISWLSKDNSRRKIILDIGANKGEWSVRCLRHAERLHLDCTIYSFEPNPTVFQSLQEESYSQRAGSIIPVNFGIGEFETTRDLLVTNDHSMSSYCPRPGLPVSGKVSTNMLNYTGIQSIVGATPIDLIKIDTEGFEVSVLRGLLPRLENDLPVIQFEYGKTWVPNRAALFDVFQLLAPLGYNIGRIHPTWIAWEDYNLDRSEHFRYGNYVAISAKHRGSIGI